MLRTAQNTIFFRAATIASPASNEYFLDTKPVVAMRQLGASVQPAGSADVHTAEGELGDDTVSSTSPSRRLSTP